MLDHHQLNHRSLIVANDVRGHTVNVITRPHRPPAPRSLRRGRRRLVAPRTALRDLHACERLTISINRWRDDVVAHDTPSDPGNGPIEAVNLLVGKIGRLGHGYRGTGRRDG